jgi:hypothetical protein
MANKASTKKETPSRFSGFGGKPQQKSRKLRPGKYVVLMDDAEYITSTRQGPAIRIGFHVLGCVEPCPNPEDVHPKFMANKPSRAGEKLDHMYWDRSEGWDDHFATMVHACHTDGELDEMGALDEEGVLTPEYIETVIGEEQALSGRVVVVTQEHRYRKNEYKGNDLPRKEDGTIDFTLVEGYCRPFFWNCLTSTEEIQDLISEEEWAKVAHLFESGEEGA